MFCFVQIRCFLNFKGKKQLSRILRFFYPLSSQLPVQDTEIAPATSLPAKLELSPLREPSACCPPPASPTSHSSKQEEREEEGSVRTISQSSTSSSCRATYTNLGESIGRTFDGSLSVLCSCFSASAVRF